jgi:hypothetical protein
VFYLYFEHFSGCNSHTIHFKVESFCPTSTLLWFSRASNVLQNARKLNILISTYNDTQWFLYADYLCVVITIIFPFIHKNF